MLLQRTGRRKKSSESLFSLSRHGSPSLSSDGRRCRCRAEEDETAETGKTAEEGETKAYYCTVRIYTRMVYYSSSSLSPSPPSPPLLLALYRLTGPDLGLEEEEEEEEKEGFAKGAQRRTRAAAGGP